MDSTVGDLIDSEISTAYRIGNPYYIAGIDPAEESFTIVNKNYLMNTINFQDLVNMRETLTRRWTPLYDYLPERSVSISPNWSSTLTWDNHFHTIDKHEVITPPKPKVLTEEEIREYEEWLESDE